MTKATLTTIFLISLILLSCYPDINKNKISSLKRYYINFSERGYEFFKQDSLPLNETWQNENILDSSIIYFNKKPILIKKISNYPNEYIDGGFVAYYEESLGVFYLKSTTWRSFILLKTNNDSINHFIDILLGSILANSNMFLNPRQIDIINSAPQDPK
jgi:hypothetical protein